MQPLFLYIKFSGKDVLVELLTKKQHLFNIKHKTGYTILYQIY